MICVRRRYKIFDISITWFSFSLSLKSILSSYKESHCLLQLKILLFKIHYICKEWKFYTLRPEVNIICADLTRLEGSTYSWVYLEMQLFSQLFWFWWCFRYCGCLVLNVLRYFCRVMNEEMTSGVLFLHKDDQFAPTHWCVILTSSTSRRESANIPWPWFVSLPATQWWTYWLNFAFRTTWILPTMPWRSGLQKPNSLWILSHNIFSWDLECAHRISGKKKFLKRKAFFLFP